jgi:hypothetical protein
VRQCMNGLGRLSKNFLFCFIEPILTIHPRNLVIISNNFYLSTKAIKINQDPCLTFINPIVFDFLSCFHSKHFVPPPRFFSLLTPPTPTHPFQHCTFENLLIWLHGPFSMLNRRLKNFSERRESINKILNSHNGV